MLPKHAAVAVADGEILHLFQNTGDETRLVLAAMPAPALHDENADSGARHHSSAANPDDKRLEEDDFAAASAAWLNRQVLDRKIEALVIIADPRTLGELRKHYHKPLQAALRGELHKELTGHSIADIEAAISHAR